jgi:polyribonucleotide nucleotidyltransferase
MKPQPIRKTIDLGDGKVITLETGVLAKQAHGSVVLTIGKTMMLATVVSNMEAREGIDFLPLSVDYQEKFAAVGRIPGSFMRREARPSDYEILISRLIDRALRPLFPEDYHAEIQVLVTLMSSDDNILPDALAGLAASAAVVLSDIPFDGPLTELRVGRINGQFVINPTREEMKNSDLDIIVGGTAHDLNMVEGEMSEVSESDMVEALKFAHQHIKTICQAQLDLAELAGGRKAPRAYSHEINDEELKKQVHSDLYQKLYDIAVGTTAKNERSEAFDKVLKDYVESFGPELESEKAGLIKKYYKSAKKTAVRNMVLETRTRLDGRALDEVRPIWSEVDYLPSAHGSAVFTRGETQSITSVTLGSKLDQQLLDSPNLFGHSKFLLHYNFPAFSTGEARPNRGVGRREIGHGNLAKRGLEKMLPDDVSYTIRIVSDILESNGSSSMATVCAGSLALMDAGIQMKSGVSGIAMGMISDETTGKYAILSDILGDEDHLGDMDFKVIGNHNGILACQMDIKVNGLSYEVLSQALEQAKNGRLHILGEMEKTLANPREDYKPHTPRIIKFAIEKDKIGAVIGTGGKVIQELQAKTNTTISIEEVDGKGWVEIMSANLEDMAAAKAYVDGLCAEAEEGKTYDGVVKGIQDFGAFVEFLPGKQGLLHISEIDYKRIDSMEGLFQEGDELQVVLLEVDKKTGKYRLSRKPLLEKPEGYVEPERRERSGGDRRDSRGGDRRDSRGGDRRDSRGGDRDRGGDRHRSRD